MRTSRLVWVFCVLVSCCALSIATADETVKTTKLNDRLYLLTTDQGAYTTHTIASVGEDGVLLVDTQAESDAEALKKVVEAFGRGAPKIIINTHRHVEHVGGNAIFGEDPIVIAHELVPARLRSGSYLFNEFPRSTFPDITFADSLTLWFNGEEIHLQEMAGSHDDNEIIVHFTESKVVHLSSLVNGFNFPSVDTAGDPLMFSPLVKMAIESLPEDVTIVSGHNRTGSVEDLRAYREMLMDTEKAVREGLAAGKDVETLQKEKVLEGWSAYAESYVSIDDWTETLATALKNEWDFKPSVMEPIFHEWKANGAQAAAGLYLEIKEEDSGEYSTYDTDLLTIGDKMLEKGYTKAAIVFLELSLTEYPDSQYGYYVNYNLALAYRDFGDREKALNHCSTAAGLKPESKTIADLLSELEGGEID
jgi:cyclase